MDTLWLTYAEGPETNKNQNFWAKVSEMGMWFRCYKFVLLNTLLFLQVACGLNHTLAVSADGSMVWAFGDGDYGKLGLGNSTAKSSPQVGIVFVLVPVFSWKIIYL